MNKARGINLSKWLSALGLLLICNWAAADITCFAGGSCTQTIALNPGWNAIYLKVKPEIKNTDDIFADFLDDSGPQISSVWTWLAHRARVDFILDPSTEDLLSQPGWLRFFRPDSDEAFLSNLFTLNANTAYLVKLEGDVAHDLVVSGTPVVPRMRWKPNALNLTGFHIDGTNPPTFDDFFAASPAHANSAIFQLDSASGEWQPVDAEETDMHPDRAYWIFSDGGSNYTGPVNLEPNETLDYGVSVGSRSMNLRNQSESSLDVNVSIVANGTPLHYQNPDPISETRWLALPLNTDIEGRSDRRLRISITRGDFAPGNYNETMEVVVPGYTRWLIPVVASTPNAISHSLVPSSILTAALQKLVDWLVPPVFAQTDNWGLWIGVVDINQVSQANNYRHDCVDNTPEQTIPDPNGLFPPVYIGTDEGAGADLCTDEETGVPTLLNPNEITDTASTFQFRILLHQDLDGNVNLLKEVMQAWEEEKGVEGEDGYVAAHDVLLVNDILLSESNYEGFKLRDGELVGVRTSSIAYDFEGDILAMSGSIAGEISQTYTLAPDSPTNPFRHIYHDQHKLGFEVTRNITLTFVAKPGESDGGTEVRSGTYTEIFTGLHNNPITAAGTFTLQQLSTIAELTTSP